jgi:hypothetical protein
MRRRRRGDGRRPYAAREQRELAEEVAGAEPAEQPAAPMNLGLSVDEHEELVRDSAFADEATSGRDVELVDERSDGSELRSRAVGEERNAPHELDLRVARSWVVDPDHAGLLFGSSSIVGWLNAAAAGSIRHA